jgi:hypothetical protein
MEGGLKPASGAQNERLLATLASAYVSCLLPASLGIGGNGAPVTRSVFPVGYVRHWR